MPSKWEDCRIMSLCSEKIPCMFLHIHDDEIRQWERSYRTTDEEYSSNNIFC